MGRPVTINGRELNFNDAPFIEANAEYSVTVDDDGTVMVERTDLKAENDKLARRLAQYELFCKIVGDPAHEFASLRRELHRIERENIKLRDFIELLLSCPRDSDECKECRRLNDLCAVELEAEKLGIEVIGK